MLNNFALNALKINFLFRNETIMNFTNPREKIKRLATTKRSLGSENVLTDRLNNVLSDSGIPNSSIYSGI